MPFKESSRPRLLTELFVLWGGLPTVLFLERAWAGRVIIPGLVLVGIACHRHLSRRGTWKNSTLYAAPPSAETRSTLLTRVLPGLALLAVLVYSTHPELFLRFPSERPGMWAAVMLGYPLLSVLPQELLFRSFFFARYGSCFRSDAALVFWSGLLFGWAHAIMGNWVAVSMSTLGGWMFAYSYLKTRSLTLAWLEHGLWGCAIFTFGFGRYFFGGNALHG